MSLVLLGRREAGRASDTDLRLDILWLFNQIDMLTWSELLPTVRDPEQLEVLF